MNRSKIAAACLAVMLMCALTGCQLALADKGAETAEDRLVGVLVTTEYLDLFNMEGYLNDNIGSFQGGESTIDGNAKAYQGRLYAELETKTATNEETGEKTEIYEYAFTGVKGIPFVSARVPATEERESYYISVSDEAITDGHTNLNVGDLENSVAIEGTIYVSPTGNESTYYLNPVYQSADGRVYATSGSGFSTGEGFAEGEVFSQTMTASSALTENGKALKDCTSVKLTLNVMNPPKKIVVLQMDGDSKVISRKEYAPGTLPKEITPDRNAAYLLVETHKTDPEGKTQISRTLFEKGKQSLDTFFCREDGICVKQWTQLDWVK